jgi:thioredoxin 1
MPIAKPANYQEIMAYSRQYPQQLVVLDCKASWCGPCKALHPELVKLAEQLPQVQFMEVDVEDPDHEDTVATFQITAMPTILYLVGGNQVMDRTVGANLTDIKAKVSKVVGVAL